MRSRLERLVMDTAAAAPQAPAVWLHVHAPRLGLTWRGGAGPAATGPTPSLRIASNTKTFVAGAVLSRPAACLYFNAVHALVQGTGQTLAELAANATNYKAQIARETAASDKLAQAKRLAVQRLARGVIPDLDTWLRRLTANVTPDSLGAGR
jgi:hypothetical protein